MIKRKAMMSLPPSSPVGRVLVDTHCHVHVSPNQDSRKEVAASCCGPSTYATASAAAAAAAAADTAARMIDRTSNYSNSSSGGASRAVEELDLCHPNRCTLGHGGERHPCEKEAGETLRATPRVMHITMGIREEDWVRAARFANSADNPCLHLERLSHAADAVEPVRKSRQQQSSTSSGSEARGEDDIGATAPFFRFGIGLHPWWVFGHPAGTCSCCTRRMYAQQRIYYRSKHTLHNRHNYKSIASTIECGGIYR